MQQRLVVQHYQPQTHPSHHYPSLYHNESPYFYEDEVFQELERTGIVENYDTGMQAIGEHDFMDVEEQEDGHRMEEEGPYEEMMMQDKPDLPRVRKNILDSASSEGEFPQRKSSISSMS